MRISGLLNLEPFVANKADVPCATEQTALIPSTTLGPLSLEVLSAKTTSAPNSGSAEAAVAKVGLDLGTLTEGVPGLPGLPSDLDILLGGLLGTVVGSVPLDTTIAAQVLTSSASATCVNGQPSFASTSKVVGLKIGDTVVNIPDDGSGSLVLDLGTLVRIYVNERVTTDNSVTQRALRIHSDLLNLDVVVAESSANVEACGSQPPPPPTCDPKKDKSCGSQPPPKCDPKDKSGDCYTPPAKTYACSDGKDNDGDKLIDRKDPGCHSDSNAKNRKSYNPQDNNEYNKYSCSRKKHGHKKGSKKGLTCKKVGSKS